MDQGSCPEATAGNVHDVPNEFDACRTVPRGAALLVSRVLRTEVRLTEARLRVGPAPPADRIERGIQAGSQNEVARNRVARNTVAQNTVAQNRVTESKVTENGTRSASRGGPVTSDENRVCWVSRSKWVRHAFLGPGGIHPGSGSQLTEGSSSSSTCPTKGCPTRGRPTEGRLSEKPSYRKTPCQGWPRRGNRMGTPRTGRPRIGRPRTGDTLPRGRIEGGRMTLS